MRRVRMEILLAGGIGVIAALMATPAGAIVYTAALTGLVSRAADLVGFFGAPDAWSLMITGFGLVGTQLRRHNGSRPVTA